MSLENNADRLKKLFNPTEEHSILDGKNARDKEGFVFILKILTKYILDLEMLVSAIKVSAEAEQIHSFRVLLRKIRTIIKGEPRLFSLEDTEKMINLFSSAVAYSGEARDISILLSSLRAYFPAVPQSFKGGQKSFTAALRNRASVKRRSLKNYLKSSDFEKAYESICGLLIKYFLLARDDESDSINVKDFAEKRIMLRYGKVLDYMEKIENPNDEQIHQLRILCKKLRYTLEIFAPYADVKKTEKTISKLKKLQDMLGSYNDLCVQGNILRYFSSTLKGMELAVLASVMTVSDALKICLEDDIRNIYCSMYKKDNIFSVKKKYIRKYSNKKEHNVDDVVAN